MLHARKPTRGNPEYNVIIKGVPFQFVDVGGQRSQREKWFQIFDEVASILFFVSSSAFDQTIQEDRVTNRLVESVDIFDAIVNNRFFRSVPIILFFNKTDLLIEKIKTKHISDYFTDFKVCINMSVYLSSPTQCYDMSVFCEKCCIDVAFLVMPQLVELITYFYQEELLFIVTCL